MWRDQLALSCAIEKYTKSCWLAILAALLIATLITAIPARELRWSPGESPGVLPVGDSLDMRILCRDSDESACDWHSSRSMKLWIDGELDSLHSALGTIGHSPSMHSLDWNTGQSSLLQLQSATTGNASLHVEDQSSGMHIQIPLLAVPHHYQIEVRLALRDRHGQMLITLPDPVPRGMRADLEFSLSARDARDDRIVDDGTPEHPRKRNFQVASASPGLACDSLEIDFVQGRADTALQVRHHGRCSQHVPGDQSLPHFEVEYQLSDSQERRGSDQLRRDLRDARLAPAMRWAQKPPMVQFQLQRRIDSTHRWQPDERDTWSLHPEAPWQICAALGMENMHFFTPAEMASMLLKCRLADRRTIELRLLETPTAGALQIATTDSAELPPHLRVHPPGSTLLHWSDQRPPISQFAPGTPP